MLLSPSQRAIPAVIYLIVITIAFLLPGAAFPQENWFSKVYLDKWVHVIIFAILACLWAWTFSLADRRKFFYLIIIVALYGLVIEILQGAFVPNRSFDLFDLTADIAGALVGIAVRGRSVKK